MFSLSTSWNSAKHKDGFGIIKEIKRLGFDTVELNFALTESMITDILSLKEKSEINISSLHNICPLPKEVEVDEASPDYYSLASPDEEERELAVEVTKNTINYANRLGARAVVLHAGRVQIKDHTRDLALLISDEKRMAEFRAVMIKERNDKKDGYLDNVIKSLKEIIPYAKEKSVSLGIENRYYYREIPIIEEFDIIFKTFEKGSVYYWHDVGHAEVFDRLGLGRHEDLLKKFSDRLIGMHLHDIIGYLNDHKAPGRGTFDFNKLKPYVKDDTIKVIEAHQPATGSEIKRSLRLLKNIFS